MKLLNVASQSPGLPRVWDLCNPEIINFFEVCDTANEIIRLSGLCVHTACIWSIGKTVFSGTNSNTYSLPETVTNLLFEFWVGMCGTVTGKMNSKSEVTASHHHH